MILTRMNTDRRDLRREVRFVPGAANLKAVRENS